MYDSVRGVSGGKPGMRIAVGEEVGGGEGEVEDMAGRSDAQ